MCNTENVLLLHIRGELHRALCCLFRVSSVVGNVAEEPHRCCAFVFFHPLTAGAVHIRFLQFLLAHYISAFKPVKDKK